MRRNMSGINRILKLSAADKREPCYRIDEPIHLVETFARDEITHGAGVSVSRQPA